MKTKAAAANLVRYSYLHVILLVLCMQAHVRQVEPTSTELSAALLHAISWPLLCPKVCLQACTQWLQPKSICGMAAGQTRNAESFHASRLTRGCDVTAGALVLSSGSASDAGVTTRASQASTKYSNGCNDLDMKAASNIAMQGGQNLFDCSILTFSITPTASGPVSFSYVFGSEEYPGTNQQGDAK